MSGVPYRDIEMPLPDSKRSRSVSTSISVLAASDTLHAPPATAMNTRSFALQHRRGETQMELLARLEIAPPVLETNSMSTRSNADGRHKVPGLNAYHERTESTLMNRAV